MPGIGTSALGGAPLREGLSSPAAALFLVFDSPHRVHTRSTFDVHGVNVEKGDNVFLVFLAIISVACMKRRAWGSQSSARWHPRHRYHRHESDESRPSEEDRFEEWHRMVHDREHGDQESPAEQV